MTEITTVEQYIDMVKRAKLPFDICAGTAPKDAPHRPRILDFAEWAGSWGFESTKYPLSDFPGSPMLVIKSALEAGHTVCVRITEFDEDAYVEYVTKRGGHAREEGTQDSFKPATAEQIRQHYHEMRYDHNQNVKS